MISSRATRRTIPNMIEADADPLDTDVEDADLFLGLEDDDG